MEKSELLENFASEIKAENHFIKASFGGFAGSGKTRTAAEFIVGCYKLMKISKSKPLLFIDNEKGGRFLIPFFAEKLPKIKVLIKETVQLADILQAFDYLEKEQIGFLFIDSLTKVWYKYIDQYKAAIGKNKKFMYLQDWGNVIPEWQKIFADRFVNVEGNVVFTGRGGHKYELEETEDSTGKKKKEFVKSGVKMKMAGETPFEPDLNVWMEQIQEFNENGKIQIWREALVMKDRANLIDGMTFKNPTFDDFKPVVECLMNLPIGKVNKETNDESHAPHEDRDWQMKKAGIEIELEKIKNQLILFNLGTSAEDKKIKLILLQKFFQTNSWKEIETKEYKLLRERRIDLEFMFEKWHEIETTKRESFIKEWQRPLDLKMEDERQ